MPFQRLRPEDSAYIERWVAMRAELGTVKTLAAQLGVSVATVERIRRQLKRRAEQADMKKPADTRRL